MPKSYQNDWDKTYCYPKSNVLKNKLNVKEQDELYNAERYATKMRSHELMRNPIKGNFDFNHLKKIHYELFKDIYDWAGKPRTVNIAKGELFCLPDWILNMSDDIFEKLKKEKYLIGLNKNQACEKFAYYTGEINALHPFREGNGRTQREFIRELGMAAGFDINFKGITKEEMIQASIDSFNCNYDSLKDIYKKATIPYTIEEHQNAAKQVLKKDSDVARTAQEYFTDTNQIQDAIKKAGFKASEKSVKGILQLNQILGKKHTLAEIKQLHKQKENLAPNQKELVVEVVEDFKKQEMDIKRHRGLER